MTQRRFVLQSFTSLVDQAWLSAINLFLGLALIRLATKDAYGIYAQLFVGALFVASMMESIIVNPLTTLAPRKKDATRNRLISELSQFQRVLGLALSIATAAICFGVLYGFGYSNSLLIAITFGAFVYTNSIREFGRSVGFIAGNTTQVLKGDLVYGGCLIAGVIGLAAVNQLHLPLLFAVMAIANVVALTQQDAIRRPVRFSKRSYSAAVASVWRRARLGLPGAVIAWVINYSYLFLAALWIGVEASADLSASRLLLMPISLLVVAWSRVARPHLSRQIMVPEHQSLHRTLLASIGSLVMLSLIYIACLWWALPWLQTTVLGPEYASTHQLILPWGLYFVLYTVHMVGTALLLSSDRYPMLLSASIASLALLVITIGFTLAAYGTKGAIITLIVIEIFNVALIWGYFYPAVRRQYRLRG